MEKTMLLCKVSVLTDSSGPMLTVPVFPKTKVAWCVLEISAVSPDVPDEEESVVFRVFLFFG